MIFFTCSSTLRTILAIAPVAAVLLAPCACSPESAPADPARSEHGARHLQSLQLGLTDNIEVVAAVPNSASVVAVASKARKVTLFDIANEQLQAQQSITLFADDASQSELTSLAIAPDGSWGVLTRTLLRQDGSGTTIDCGGELVFVSLARDATFGTILAHLPVGPMPDDVAISADGRYVASANERDVVWGKCEGVAGLEVGSVSIVDVSSGVAAASEVARVLMSSDSVREPEQVAFADDDDLLAVTLQDSHELGLLRISEILQLSAPSDADMVITPLPANGIGQQPWPDGVAFVRDAEGRAAFVTAGEGNDQLTVVSTDGTVLAQIDITEADLPAAWPRGTSWGPLFSPDSLVVFSWSQRRYLATTLKASGALLLWNVDRLAAPLLVGRAKLGLADSSAADGGSIIGSEGICASDSGGFIAVANEAESSLTLLGP